MKIQSATFPGRSQLQANASFSYALRRAALPKTPAPLAAPARPQASTALSSLLGAGEMTAVGLKHARPLSFHSTAQLQQVRAAHHQIVNERLDSRLVDQICQELVIEFTDERDRSRVANQDLPLPPPTLTAQPTLPAVPRTEAPRSIEAPIDGTARAAQAVDLIERIESFIKDSRTPCIAITLNNSLGAKVEIERVGPRSVALKVVGHQGPPRAEDISRIRDEMRARGLKVCALSVA